MTPEVSRALATILGSPPRPSWDERDRILDAFGEVDTIEELPDDIKELLVRLQSSAEQQRFNPNHSKKDGKFTGKGGGAGTAPLSAEQYETLRPTGAGFSRARADAAVAKLSATPEGKVIADLADDFQHAPSDQLRNEIAAVNSTGRYQTKKGTERAKAFLHASANVPRDILPDKLYRGVTIAGDNPSAIAEGYRKRGSVTMNVSSFTASSRIAREYTTYHVGANTAKPKFVKVITTVNVGKKAQMLPIQNISRGKDTHRDQEYLGLGTFKVNRVRVSGNEVHIEIEQTGLILPKEAQ